MPRVGVEPGRTLVAPAGTTIYRVNAIKRQASRTFVVVDGGIAENPRPALYEAHHYVDPASGRPDGGVIEVTICGRSCENDELGPAVVPRDLAVGELLAMCTTGAYTYSMASNYNRFPAPGRHRRQPRDDEVLARRETIDEMLATDRRRRAVAKRSRLTGGRARRRPTIAAWARVIGVVGQGSVAGMAVDRITLALHERIAGPKVERVRVAEVAAHAEQIGGGERLGVAARS